MNRPTPLCFPRRGRVLACALLVALGAALGTMGAASAATLAGSITLVKGVNPGAGSPVSSGGSALQFALQLPSGAACTGDTSTGGYRVQTFIVSSNVTVSALTFDAGGPTPSSTGATVRLPLFNLGTPYIDGNTAVGSGAITGLPPFDFSVFGSSGPTVLPNGTYTLGVACTKGVAGPTQVDKYWTTQITVTATPSDTPSGLTWSSGSVTPPTSTTAAPTTAAPTTVAPTTAAPTTSVAGGTTTTSPTTTVAGATTTTTTTAGSTSTTLNPLATTTTVDYGSGGLVATGSSPVPMVIWGVLLLLLGRIVVLVARPVRVRPPEGR